jgi:hypothetical protein
MANQSYDELLAAVESRLPDLHRTLHASQAGRARHLVQYANGARLSGADELLRHLRLLEGGLREHGHDGEVGFLVARATADFEIAIEAALTGMLCLAHDAMRDVMEIEFLLREFTAEPGQLDRWLHADQATLKTEFSPNRMRQREANRLSMHVRDLPGHEDYKGHSLALHVTPSRSPVTRKGLVDDADLLFGSDMAFWELFLHARRFVFALHDLLRHDRFVGVLNPDPNTTLPKVASAYELTQEMQAMFFALLGAIPEDAGASDDDA